MISEEEFEAISNLFHLQHINTYLDLSKDNFQIKSKTIIDWSKSTETVLNLVEIQRRMIDSMTEIISNNTVPKEECKQCIIEYFRNKAKESE